MAKMECSVKECTDSVIARTWCSHHYEQWRQYGSPLGRPLRDRHTQPGEEWRPVPGWEKLYEVSSAGRVWSVRRQRILKGAIDGYGYRKVALCWNRNSPGGEQRQVAIHRIEAEAFLGPRPEGKVVRHVDGNPLNLAIENLIYGTQAENLEDAMMHGTALNLRRKQRTECINGHVYVKVGFYINGQGARICKQCDRDKTARFLAKKRAASGR